ncbi:hypothetical protein GCM10027321_01550 [Massilia terrae]|uniref:DUF5985 family protein n=1 Tax=Massilia terrae TaxID=1811224 RepID=A0ABT2CU23_9BURK|nr:DUF5985 family protein [Massilia terrae]MCS0657483.1 DUF5985 family protein [Massilia terrae]
MNDVLTGAIAMGSMVVALFFLRFWRNTGDRFFLYFSLSFLIEGLHRIYSTLHDNGGEDSPTHYVIRVLAYGLILWAIFEKNLPREKKSG